MRLQALLLAAALLGSVEPLLAPCRRRSGVEPLLAPCRRRRARRAAIKMSDAAQPVLWGENLVKSHDGARRQLDDASLVLREGQHFQLCDGRPSGGCGKSTLLEIISGSDRPDGGGVRPPRGVKVTAVPRARSSRPRTPRRRSGTCSWAGTAPAWKRPGPTPRRRRATRRNPKPRKNAVAHVERAAGDEFAWAGPSRPPSRQPLRS